MPEQPSGDDLPEIRTRWSEVSGGIEAAYAYRQRFDDLVAQGVDVHGEARLVTALRPPPKGPGMGLNSGLEALAIRDGTPYAVPERSGAEDRPFPILTFRDNRWDQAGEIRRDPRWLPVGADFGPDGWFYLLERDFQGILGFASRVRRMELTDAGPRNEEILLTTRALQYDNLEGLAVWHDGQGIRLTMISDDNFLFVQRTELVEYRLRD